MSIAQLRARLVHRDRGLAVAGDPGAVAERLVERLPEDDRGVLGGVVGAGLQVAADGDVEVEAPVPGEQVEHVVEEADAGRAGARAGAVERQRQRDLGLAVSRGDLALRWLIRLAILAAGAGAASTRAWSSKPSARAIGAPAGGELRGAGADPDLGHAAAKVPRRERRGEACGAGRSGARGWSPAT